MTSKYKVLPPPVQQSWKASGDNPAGFDENILPSPQRGFMLALSGGRNTGKSVVCYNLIKQYAGAFDGIFVMSPTWKQDSTIAPEATGLEEENYFETLDTKFITELMEKQREEKKKHDKGQLRQKFLSRYLLVLDDCISEEMFSKNQNSSVLNALAFKGRHFRISTIITTQSYKSLPRKFRINVPNWVLMRTYNAGERKSICEELCNTMSEKDFDSMYNHAIEEDYSFFYVFMDAPNKKECFRKNFETILSN